MRGKKTKAEKREIKKKEEMKVSGKSVFQVKEIILKKSSQKSNRGR